MSEPEVDTSALNLLTVGDVSRQLRVSPVTVHRLVRAGKLESVKIGRSRRFTQAMVTEYVNGLVSAQRQGVA